MTKSADILRKKGGLILSPAVRPSEAPISSSAGMADAPADLTGKVQRVDVNTVAADGSGEARVIFSGPGSGYKWTVERASIGSVNGSFTNCEVHAGDFKEAQPFDTLVDTSDVPASDVADESSPIYVGPEQTLLFRFLGGAGGDDATARIQYTEEPV